MFNFTNSIHDFEIDSSILSGCILLAALLQLMKNLDKIEDSDSESDCHMKSKK
jgi:hypothetical protein